ncbi:putative signal transducing protein [Maribacter sp. LLG6340-A2]|uniref:putative signal transducing protein n=1 Tax=Maribacter sp. LLG6340-A2 TaxID=3160834 RepID=UPI0038680125
MNSAYKKVFGGNPIKANRVELILKDNNIHPIRKDESESARLAGFGSTPPQIIEIFVHENEEVNALTLISKIKWNE